MFVHRLGCDMADRFAAVAPVAGTLAKGFNCAPDASASTSIMHLYPGMDKILPPDGSEGSSGYFVVPVEAMMDAWASTASQGCEETETPYPTSRDGERGLACRQRANCATGAQVVACSWEGNHDSALDILYYLGNDVIWDFFGQNGAPK